jgi:hypothetical protein
MVRNSGIGRAGWQLDSDGACVTSARMKSGSGDGAASGDGGEESEEAAASDAEGVGEAARSVCVCFFRPWASDERPTCFWFVTLDLVTPLIDAVFGRGGEKGGRARARLAGGFDINDACTKATQVQAVSERGCRQRDD